MTPSSAPRAPTTAVVLAGGSGKRFGGTSPKQLLTLAGRPLVAHSLDVFEQCPEVDDIVVVMPADRVQVGRMLVDDHGFGKVVAVVAGGASRSESSMRGLDAIARDAGNVLIHDAARPLLSPVVVAACVEALTRCPAVVVAVPAADTMLAVDDGTVRDVVDRGRLWRAQTPQGFHLPVIRTAYAAARQDPAFAATDDCSVVLRYLPDAAVRVVPGSPDNIKVTLPADLVAAEALLRSR